MARTKKQATIAEEEVMTTPSSPVEERREEAQETWWFAEAIKRYEASLTHCYVVRGNVYDYVNANPGLTMKRHFFSSYKQFDITMYWNQAIGLEFASEEMKERFCTMIGVSPKDLKIKYDMSKPLTVLPFMTTLLHFGKNKAERDQIAAMRFAETSDDQTDQTELQRIKEREARIQQIIKDIIAKKHLTSRQKEEQVASLNEERDGIYKNPFRVCVIIDYTDTVIPHSDQSHQEERKALIHLLEMGRDKSIGALGNVVYMLAPSIESLHGDIARTDSCWMPIEVPLPSEEKRKLFLERCLSNNPHVQVDPSTSIEEIARLTRGLMYLNLEDIILQASYLKVPVSLDLVRWRRNEIIKYEFGGLLEVIDTEKTFKDIGGLEDIKELVRRSVITPMKAGIEKRKLIPAGILLMGPSGTGKSAFAEAIAGECIGIPFVRLNPSALFDKFVGETEKRLRDVIVFLKAMGRCILFVDEIDQSFTGRGESSSNPVQSNVFSTFLQLMSDPWIQGRIVIIAATNRPDLLDAAFKRPGRLDYKLIIPPPNKAECATILKVLTKAHFKLSGRVDYPTDEEYTAIGDQMEGYTGAEIEAVAKKASRESEWKKDLSIYQLLNQAYQSILPTTQDIDEMILLALIECPDMDTVPDRYKAQRRAMSMKPQKKAVSRRDEEEEEVITGRRARSF